MARTKTKTDGTKLVLQRLALDQEVQGHLGDAVVQLREAWGRVAHRPAARAVEDKKLYAKVREAAISVARALKLLAPEPEPPKHRVRNMLALAVAAGGAGALIKKKRGQAAAGKPGVQSPPAQPSPPVPQPQPTEA
jgi:hypothetical protein